MTLCRKCGQPLALTSTGRYGHVTNPTYKHHWPTPVPQSAPVLSEDRARSRVSGTRKAALAR